MSLGHGSSIVTNGLVFYYDQANTQKSWRGRPITNLLTNPDFASGNTGYNSYVSSGPTTVTVTDFPGNNGRPKVVLQCTSASAPGGGGNSGGMYFANPSLTTGLAYTMSFWARILSHTSATNTFSNQSGSGDNSNFAFSQTITTNWTKFSYTTNSLDLMKSQWYVWTNQNSATWQYADFQIEQNTFASPFVSGTRSSSQAVLDMTGINTINAASLSYQSNNTFTFNGTSDYLSVPLTNLGTQRNTFTIELWAKISGSTANLLFNAKGQGLYPRITNTGSNIVQVQYRPNGVTTSINSNTITLNTWYHFVFTYDSSAGGKLYTNGILTGSETTTLGTHDGGTAGSMLIGNDTNLNYWGNGNIDQVKMYDKVLTAQEIEQNFNAHRARYGI